LAKDLIISLKFNGSQAAAKTMANVMAGYIDSDEPMLLMPVPTTTGRIRQRGYDQAQLIAHELSRLVRQPVVPYLVRTGRVHQVGASRRQRLLQLRSAFRLKRRVNLAGKHVILIDDVCTTGATLEAAARAVKQAGAKRVEAIVYAQA
jgi:ComF family protein